MSSSPAELAAEVRGKLADTIAADTLENELRLTALLKSKGVIVKRGRQKNPARYTVTMQNSSIGPVTLLDLEQIWNKVSRGSGSRDPTGNIGGNDVG